MPQGEIPHQQTQRGERRPEDKPIVNICNGVECVIPRKGLAKDLSSRFVLFFFENSICNQLGFTVRDVLDMNN